MSLCVTPALFFSNVRMKSSRPTSATQESKASLIYIGVQGQPQVHRCSRLVSVTQEFEANLHETGEKKVITDFKIPWVISAKL